MIACTPAFRQTQPPKSSGSELIAAWMLSPGFTTTVQQLLPMAGGQKTRQSLSHTGGVPDVTSARRAKWCRMPRGGALTTLSIEPSAVRAANTQWSPACSVSVPDAPNVTLMPSSSAIAAPALAGRSSSSPGAAMSQRRTRGWRAGTGTKALRSRSSPISPVASLTATTTARLPPWSRSRMANSTSSSSSSRWSPGAKRIQASRPVDATVSVDCPATGPATTVSTRAASDALSRDHLNVACVEPPPPASVPPRCTSTR